MSENENLELDSQQEETDLHSHIGEGTGNLDICPNCLEPNTDDLAVCKYCGMPLHQGADPDEFLIRENEAQMEAARREAAPEPKKPEKKQENGFRRVMPWLGLYLIYYAITGCIDMKRQIDQAQAEGQAVNVPLAYFSQAIWFAAGLLMAWPLIKKGYRKLRHLPEEDEVTENTPEENAEPADAVTGPMPEEQDEETFADIREDEAEELPAAQTEDPEVRPEEDPETETEAADEDGFEEEDADAKWL